MASTGYLRPTRVIVNRQAITHNIQNELRQLDDHTALFAVIKANAYGHGMLEVAKTAKDAGATGFCVAILDEALDLRRANFTTPILVLGVSPAQSAPLFAVNAISVTVGTLDWLQKAYQKLTTANIRQKLFVHLAVDTGMGRIGFTDQQALQDAIDFMQEHDQYFEFEGIFTHFATADAPDKTYFQQQAQQFNQVVDNLKQKPRYIHVANTATSLWHQKCAGNMIRFGVGMYGLNPSGRVLTLPYPLESAMAIESELSFVKRVPKGTKIGYGATYTAEEDQWIGTLPIGYADGWLRRLQGSHVLIEGQFCEVVGRICMDQMMVRLPQDFKAGTKVTLIGENNGKHITVDDIAEAAQTINYEIVCDLSDRLPRIYQD